jgi:hypothetical protein
LRRQLAPKGGSFDPAVSAYAGMQAPLRSYQIALIEHAKAPAGK